MAVFRGSLRSRILLQQLRLITKYFCRFIKRFLLIIESNAANQSTTVVLGGEFGPGRVAQ
jgi:hypothetical protein